MTDARFLRQMVPLHKKMYALAFTGTGILALGFWLAPDRAWRDLLLGSFAVICFGLGGLVFVAMQYASGAVWSIALRRVGEAMMAVLPFGGLGILLVLIARPHVYPWYQHLELPAEGWVGFKRAWLSYPFFLFRSLVYIVTWLAFARAIRRNSRQQDEEGGWQLNRRNTRLSVAFLAAFGITFWLASTDWVMSLEPHWASTIFGIYNFAGMFSAGLAAVILLALLFQRLGPLRSSVSAEHLHDLGRLLLAFATFWGYIWFSQYMLIWYANLTEETTYMVVRTNFGWGKLFVLNLLLNWAIPFLLLLPAAKKRTARPLAWAAVTVLAGRIIDLYLMIIPPFSPTNFWPQLWDLAAVALAVGACVLVSTKAFFGAEPVPVGDPLLPESVHGHA